MLTTLSKMPIDVDELFYQSVVDEEFRAQLLADPSLFGLGELSFSLPVPVEPQDQTLLDLVSGANFITMCRTTCSYGPLTFWCDGDTK